MGIAKDSLAGPVAPETVLAKLVAMVEAKLGRRKVVVLVPLVPRKPSVEVIKQKTSANKLKKRPSGLVLDSDQSYVEHSPSRAGTPSSQSSDTQAPRQRNKLRKRSRSSTRSSPESVHLGLPVQAQAPVQTPPSPARVRAVMGKDRGRDRAPEVLLSHRPTARLTLGPPPSPSHGKRFEGARRSPDKGMARPLPVGPPPPRGR